ncbi:MAG: hypothetical protein GX022_00705 [Clostridiaceae bacterium]|nr:hypothetical protein [Clostridiaceae bacterium]
MNDLLKILTQHALKYPLMEPADAVKLIYQNEFGSGHFISDKEASLIRLQNEYQTVIQKADIPLLEDIGNGIARVNLAALDINGLTVELLNDIFVASSGNLHRTKNSFIRKLNILKKLTREGLFKFDIHSLQTYLNEYISLDYPPVSHSRIYREAYKPAYRVICKSLIPEKYLSQ